MAFQEITDVDQALALREARLLWCKTMNTKDMMPLTDMTTRHHLQALMAEGYKYFVLLEE